MAGLCRRCIGAAPRQSWRSGAADGAHFQSHVHSQMRRPNFFSKLIVRPPVLIAILNTDIRFHATSEALGLEPNSTAVQLPRSYYRAQVRSVVLAWRCERRKRSIGLE